MKFLHCSDLHLGKRQIGGLSEYSRKRFEDYFTSFEYFIDIAINYSIKLILICGDIFDKKELSPEVLSKTELLLKKAKDNNITIIITEGNHDNISSEKESWLIYLVNKDLAQRPNYIRIEDKIEFQSIKIEEIECYGLGYMGAFANEIITAFAEYLDIIDNKNKKVVLMHTAVLNPDILNGAINSETIDKLNGRVIYAAGGHIHSFTKYPAQNPFFFTPGCPEFWDIAEIGKKKGAIIFDTDTLEYEFIPAKNRKVHIINIKTQSNDMNELLEEVSLSFNNLNIEKGEDLAKIEINSINTFYIDFNAIEKLTSQIGILKSFIKYKPIRSDEIQIDEYSSIDEIEKEIIKGWGIFSEDVDNAHKYLEIFKHNYLNGENESFAENFDMMLKTIIEGVK